jgi:hypothetical protein
MKRKLLALAVALIFVLGTVATGFAAVPSDVKGTDYEKAVDRLMTVDVFKGYDTGLFGVNDYFTRAQLATIAVRLLGLEKAAELSAGPTMFSDVPANHWASGYINVAVNQGIIKGYGDGRFGPDDPVTYAQAITILVRTLGYGPVTEGVGTWPTNYIAKGAEIGVTKDVAFRANDPAIRGKVALMADNTLEINIMEQEFFGSLTSYKVTTKTILEDKLDIAADRWIVGEVDATPIYNGLSQIKANVISIEGTEYEVEKDIDVNDYYGLQIKALLDKDKEKIVYISVQTDDKYIVEGTFDEFDGGKLKINESSKKYDFATEAELFLNGELLTYADPATDLEAAMTGDAASVKIITNEDYKITKLMVWQESNADVVKEITKGKIKFVYGAPQIDIDALEESAEDEDIILIVEKDGQKATLDDIEVGDVVVKYEINDVVYFKVTDNKVKGELSRVRGDDASKFVVKGSTYERTENAFYSTDEGKTAKKIATNPGDLTDFVGEYVVLYLNGFGEVVYVEGDVDATSDTMYAVFIEDVSRGTPSVVEGTAEYYIRVFSLSSEKKVLLKFEEEADYVASATIPAGSLISYKLDKDGYVDGGVTVEVNSETELDDLAINKASDMLGGKFITSDTIIVNINDPIDAAESAVVKWSLVENIAGGTVKGGIVVDDDDDDLAAYVVISSSAVQSEDEYAVFIEYGYDKDGKTIELFTEAGTVIYQVDSAQTGAEKGDLLKYTVNDKGEFVANTIAGKRTGATVAEKVYSIDANNLRIKVGERNYRIDEDVVVYDVVKTTDIKVVDLESIAEGDYVRVVTNSEGLVEWILVIPKP